MDTMRERRRVNGKRAFLFIDSCPFKLFSPFFFNIRVGNNLENLKERLVLRDFPRIRVDNTRYKIGSQIALIFACISLATCLIVLVATYFHRNKNVFRYAQIEFVFLLLLGL